MTAPALPERLEMTTAQQRIVEFGDCTCVVIAGAGSGKTGVIIERVWYLLARVAAMQDDGFTATPGPACPYIDYRAAGACGVRTPGMDDRSRVTTSLQAFSAAVGCPRSAN